jgi:putrescine---pyruvate transaminase
VQDLCRLHDVLLIAVEVVTGFGRLGHWFGSERFGIQPDLVTGAKGISSGYLPLGVVLCGERIREVLWAEGAGPLRHGYTYSGHPAACAAGLANLDAIEREGLVERVRMLEPVLAAALAPLADHPLVEAVRTCGLLGGVRLATAALRHRPRLLDKVVLGARKEGVLVRALVGATVQISPPFVIAEEQLHEIADVLVRVLDACLADRDLAVAAGVAR